MGRPAPLADHGRRRSQRPAHRPSVVGRLEKAHCRCRDSRRPRAPLGQSFDRVDAPQVEQLLGRGNVQGGATANQRQVGQPQVRRQLRHSARREGSGQDSIHDPAGFGRSVLAHPSPQPARSFGVDGHQNGALDGAHRILRFGTQHDRAWHRRARLQRERRVNHYGRSGMPLDQVFQLVPASGKDKRSNDRRHETRVDYHLELPAQRPASGDGEQGRRHSPTYPRGTFRAAGGPGAWMRLGAPNSRPLPAGSP